MEPSVTFTFRGMGGGAEEEVHTGEAERMSRELGGQEGAGDPKAQAGEDNQHTETQQRN